LLQLSEEKEAELRGFFSGTVCLMFRGPREVGLVVRQGH
jgi:hypothetical protein